VLLCRRVVSKAPVGVQPRKTQRPRDFYLDVVILAILLLAIWNISQYVLVPQQSTNLGCDLGQLFQPAHLEKPAAGLLGDFLEARAVDQQTRSSSDGDASGDSQSKIFYNDQPKEEIQKAGKLHMTR